MKQFFLLFFLSTCILSSQNLVVESGNSISINTGASININGLELTPDKIEYITVEGMLKLDEVFRWTTIIIEFYFGAQLAKG